MFSTLVSNVRGQTPFVSEFAHSTTAEQRSRWEHFIAAGDTARAGMDFANAIKHYSAATQIDSMHALGFYKLGTALCSDSQFTDAARVLSRAKDLDALRFRATEEFQQILVSACASHDVPLARVDSAFVQASPDRIPGDELFLEHLHPNIEGYFLLAKTFANTIRGNARFVPPEAWSHVELPDSALMKEACITEFDRAIGKVKIDLLKRRWPFVTGGVNYEFTPSTSVESVVFRMMKGQITWSDARYLLADFHAQHGRYELARAECLALAKAIPFSYQPLLRLADFYSQEGETEEARKAYERCIETEDNPYARVKLAHILLNGENSARAASQLEQALSLDASGKYKLEVKAAAIANYLLAVAWAKQGKYEQAERHAQRASAIDPTLTEVKELREQIRRAR
jgi:tetratricopeptide (TPR) repeat protein